jgi:4-amino-4-deoxy-L-arabinose transferase-like glycosyltransferase
VSAPAYWRGGLRLRDILLLAFALRLGWTLLVPVIPQSDSAIYDIFAREIAAGRGYVFPAGNPTVYWPVGPSALYGAAYALLGTGKWVVPALNMLMGVALVAAVQRLAQRRFGPEAGWISAMILALWPTLIQFTTVLSSELPFMLLLAAALVVKDEARCSGWVRSVVVTALLVGAAYMRPTALPLIVLLPLLDFAVHRQLRRTVFQVALALLVTSALIAPWVLRNQALFGTPVLISANFGVNLWMGNNESSSGDYMPLPALPPGLGEVERDAMLKERAIRFIRANPDDYVRLSAGRIVQSFGRETIGVSWNQAALPGQVQTLLKIVSSAYWLTSLLLSLGGLWLFLRGGLKRLFDPLIVVPALLAAPAILIVGQDRYHIPVIPFVALFAALFLLNRLWRFRSAYSANCTS